MFSWCLYFCMSKREKHLMPATATSQNIFQEILGTIWSCHTDTGLLNTLTWPCSLHPNTNQFCAKTTYILHLLIIMVLAISKHTFLCPTCNVSPRILLFHSLSQYIVLYCEHRTMNWDGAPPEQVLLFAFGHPGVVATDWGSEQKESKLCNSIS